MLEPAAPPTNILKQNCPAEARGGKARRRGRELREGGRVVCDESCDLRVFDGYVQYVCSSGYCRTVYCRGR